MSKNTEGNKSFHRITAMELSLEFQKLFKRPKSEIKSLESMVQDKIVQVNLKQSFNYDNEIGDKKSKKGFELAKNLFFRGKAKNMQEEINDVLDEILDGVVKSTVKDDNSYIKKPPTKYAQSATTTKNKVHTRSTSARMDRFCYSSPSNQSQKRKYQWRQKHKTKKKEISLFWEITGVLLRRRRRRRRMRKQKKLEEQLRKKEEFRKNLKMRIKEMRKKKK